jgi:hypothetical protein
VSIEQQMASLQPDPLLCVTPPLSPWLLPLEEALAAAGGSSPEDKGLAAGKVFAKAVLSHDNVQDILAEECAHLLRKAQSAISKAYGANNIAKTTAIT